MPNRLSREKSPYLQQHADNPVDWFPWGDEAFERARREDRPIFLSIGYSTCHWCHVMAHESFESADVARLLNAEFVSIKLDREERPDIDRVYMMFVQATTGSGGWPMSVWLTPDLKPFFGGTYFPPTSRWGRPGFADVLTQLARAWRTSRAELIRSADDVIEQLRRSSGADQAAPDRAPVADRRALAAGVAGFAQAFDKRFGGFGAAPKFPRPAELMFLLNTAGLTGDWDARSMALETLRAMSRGGMRDHVGGGFHRYSVDAQWRVPHFEKMLYDQAQLALAYLDAAALSGEDTFAAVAEDTLAYVSREMRMKDGAFYSAEDADSPVVQAEPAGAYVVGESHGQTMREGAFYVWTSQELERLLEDDAPIVMRRFGVEPGGNALADPQAEFTGQNILYLAQEIEDIAARTGRSAEDVVRTLERARAQLFETRAKRPRPHLDDKVLTGWNGLMIAAFARAGAQLVESPAREDWLHAAESAARWLRWALWDGNRKRLLRRYRDAEAGIEAFAEDYAYLVWGLIELFQATGEAEWLTWALELTAVETELFYDERDGGWFSTTGADTSVLLRAKEDYDGAEPAAASVTVRNLITLGHLTANPTLLARAERTLERYGPEIGRAVRVMPLMVANVALWRGGSTQVVITGPADLPATLALERTLARRYLPWGVIVRVRSAGAGRRLAGVLPWMSAIPVADDAAAAYVCDGFTCQVPVTDAAEFDRQLEAVMAGKRVGQ